MNGIDLMTHKRGGLVTSFAAIEAKIGQYIMLQIADSADAQLTFNAVVLSQPLFSFELKKKILYDLLRKNDLYSAFPKSQLETMQRVRNIAAHGATVIDDPANSDDINALRIDHGGREYTIDQLEGDYQAADDILLPALLGLAARQPLPVRAPSGSSKG